MFTSSKEELKLETFDPAMQILDKQKEKKRKERKAKKRKEEKRKERNERYFSHYPSIFLSYVLQLTNDKIKWC